MNPFLITSRMLAHELLKHRRSESSIACLALMIEHGHDKFNGTFEQSGLTLEKAVSELLASVKTEEILKNKIIAESLLIAFVEDKRTALNALEATKRIFSARLRKIFPEKIAVELCQKGIRIYHNEAQGPRILLACEEDFEEHYRALEKMVDFHDSQPKHLIQKAVGIRTRMVPCPGCDSEKRVDNTTKRFRCKKCGYDAPYNP